MRSRFPLQLALVVFVLPAIGCAAPAAETKPAQPVAKAAAKPAPPPKPAPTALPAPPPGRLPQIATPTSYDLRLNVDPQRPTFTGDVVMHLSLHTPSDRIPFQAEHMTFTKVQATFGKTTIEGTAKPADWEGADLTHGDMQAVFDTVIPAGNVDLRFVYEAPFDKNLAGSYRAKENGHWYAYTQFEVADARKAYPCMDQPGLKQPFQLTVKVPQGMRAFSNTPGTASKNAKGPVTYTFERTRPLPTYLVAWVVGDFDVVDGPKAPVPIRGIASKGDGPMLSTGLKMSAAFMPIEAAYFGRPFPFKKLDHAALAEFAAGAMENAGLITYREVLFLADPKHSSEMQRHYLANTIAHEMAHQWSGDLVTMKWWNDIWLNEAFATWMAARTVDTWDPSYRQRLYLLRARSWVFGADSLAQARRIANPVHSVLEADQSFDGITYTKGANVLAMLEHWVGDKTFEKGIQAYIKKYAWKNATANDLLDTLDTVTGKPVKSVADTFLDTVGAPEVKLSLVCGKHKALVTLSQTRYRPLGSHYAAGLPGGKPWHIPVCLAYPAGKKIEHTCIVLESATATVPLDKARGCPAWVHPNAGEYGYYRWATPEKMVPRLATAIARHGHAIDGKGTTDPRSQTAFLDQAWAMVRSGELAPGAYLAVLSHSVRHADDTTMQQVLSSGGELAGTWPELARTKGFARLIRRLLGPTARRLGWKPKKGESKQAGLLRPQVLHALGHYGRARWVLAGAKKRAKAFLADPSSVPLSIAPVALELAASEGDITLADLEKALASAKNPIERVAIIGSLGYLPPGKPIAGALGLMLTDKIRTQDVFHIIMPALGRPVTRQQAFAFLQNNFAALAKRSHAFGPFSHGHAGQLAGFFCTEKGKNAAKAFIEKLKMPGSERFMQMGLEKADQCIALRAHGEKALAAFLGERVHHGAKKHPAKHTAKHAPAGHAARTAH